MRDSIIFYRSFYEAIRELPPETQAEVYTAIFEFSMNFTEISLTGLSKTIFTLIKPQLEANNKRFENGKKTKQSSSKTTSLNNQHISKQEAKHEQDVSKSEANNNNNVFNENVNANDNVNDKEEYINSDSVENKFSPTQTKKSIEERLETFRQQIEPFKGKYSSETLNDFWRYWTEKNSNGKKMRFEMQKVFDVGRRLITWSKNENKNFNGKSKSNFGVQSRQERVEEVREFRIANQQALAERLSKYTASDTQ